MARKPRDYKQEYARRTTRAKAQGYTGYSQKRVAHKIAQGIVDRFNVRIDTEGFDLANLFDQDTDDPEYWIWFRINYGRGTQTA